jgi:uncharacterized protein
MNEIDFNKIIPLLKGSGVISAGVFGSYAKDQQTSKSDVDLLVEFEQPIGLFSFAGLKNEISEILGLPVDLVTRKALHPMLKDNILSDVKIFYETK